MSTNTTSIRLPMLRGDLSECGDRCLYVCCRMAGKPAKLADIRRYLSRYVRDDRESKSLLMLKVVADRLGFVIQGVKTDWEGLQTHIARKDACAIIHLRKGHFIVAVRTENKWIRMIDPSLGIVDLTETQLRSQRWGWEGNALLLQPVRGRP